MKRVNNLLLLDIETTGLCQDPSVKVLEVAMAPVFFATDMPPNKFGVQTENFGINLDTIFEEKLWVPRNEEENVSPWIQRTHGENANGLLKECYEQGMRAHQLETKALAWLASQGFMPGKVIVAGNSVWTDRVHLMRHLPALERAFFYRNADFSAYKVLGSIFGLPDEPDELKDQDNHRAKPGLYAALGRLEFYYDLLIKPAVESMERARAEEQ